MKIEDIFELWNKDSKIDESNLHQESLKRPELHNKYYKILSGERFRLKKMKIDYKSLRHDKHEFYTQGPSKEQRELGWELPPKGLILKNEIDRYLDADKDLMDMALKIGAQEEKVELLVSIIQTINGRSFDIKNAIEFQKFLNGQ